MEESSTLKLIMEKGPREGETLEYPSGTVVKIGRLVRGNTIGIRDAGISSKHMCIQFDNKLSKWTLSDLDSSNGTILNGKSLEPNVSSGLKDGDCIKIGEITSIIVRIGIEATSRSERNPKRQGKSGAGAGAGAVVDRGRNGLGLGLDGDLGKIAVEEPVEKRNLRTRTKKALNLKNEVESLSCRRTVRTSRKEEDVSFIPTPNQTLEDERKSTDLFVPVEGKKTQGGNKRARKKKLPLQLPEDPNLDERKTADAAVPIDGKKTQRGGTRGRTRGRTKSPVEPSENVQSSGLQENLNNVNESVRIDVAEESKPMQGAYEGKEAAFDNFQVDPSANVENSGLEENLDTNNEYVEDHVAEEPLSMQEGCEGKEAVVDESSLKGSSEVAFQVDVDKGKEVAEELEHKQDGCEGLVKDIGPDDCQWLDLEKMTLGDFFDYLEVQLPKEIYEKSEKIISHLTDKARKCHDFRLQRNEHGNSKLPME